MGEEQLEKKYDPSKYSTQLNLYKFFGFAPGNYIFDWFRSCVPISLFLIGLVHFPLYYKVDGATKQDIIEAFHWTVAYITFLICILFMLKYRHIYFEIDRIIKSGVYDYGEDFTEEQQSICDAANKQVLKLRNTMLFAFLVCVPTSLTKHTIFRRKPGSWNTLFKGWTPFVINTWPRYILLFLLHIIMTFNTSVTGYLLVLSFLTFGIHLGTHLKILRIALRNIFHDETLTEEQILAGLKKCVGHHVEIKRFFKLVQLYSGTISGFLPIGSVGMICTFVYDMTRGSNVEISFMVILSEGCLFTIYALIGQYITNESENLRTFLYEVDWYSQPVSSQKVLLLMMISAKKSMDVKGFGVFKYSLEGLTEVMQTTYTFFNALNATK